MNNKADLNTLAKFDSFQLSDYINKQHFASGKGDKKAFVDTKQQTATEIFHSIKILPLINYTNKFLKEVDFDDFANGTIPNSFVDQFDLAFALSYGHPVELRINFKAREYLFSLLKVVGSELKIQTLSTTQLNKLALEEQDLNTKINLKGVEEARKDQVKKQKEEMQKLKDEKKKQKEEQKKQKEEEKKKKEEQKKQKEEKKNKEKEKKEKQNEVVESPKVNNWRENFAKQKKASSSRDTDVIMSDKNFKKSFEPLSLFAKA